MAEALGSPMEERLLRPLQKKASMLQPDAGDYQKNHFEAALSMAAAASPTGGRVLTRRASKLAGIDLDMSPAMNVDVLGSQRVISGAINVDLESKTTLNETTVNASLTLIGCGILGVPYAFGQAGLVSAAMMLLIAGICAWTAILIGRLMSATKPLALEHGLSEDAHDWGFLGFAAFGDAGRAWCSAVFVSELWFCMVALLVMNGINLNLILPEQLTVERGIIGSGVVSFLLLFPSAKVLAYFSVFGILSTVLAMGSLIWSAEAMTKWQMQVDVELIRVENVPLALGIFQFCFVAHSIFPSMYQGMQNPGRDYNKAMTRSFIFAGLFYLVVGTIAFLVYGRHAQSSFMANLGRELDLNEIPGKAFLYIICSACFVINLSATFPVIAMGLIAASENALKLSQAGFLPRMLWKAIFMGATTAVAVVLRQCMSPVQSLVGAFCATNTCLLLPMLCSLKILELGMASKVAMFVLLIYSVYILVSGTYTNVEKILSLV